MEKIEILQKFLLSLVPEKQQVKEEHSPSLKSWTIGRNFAVEEMIKNIKEADLEKLIHELQ